MKRGFRTLLFRISIANKPSFLSARGAGTAAAHATTALAIILLSLTSCTPGPAYHRPSAATPAAPNYKESPVNFPDDQGWKVASPQDSMLRGNWWEVFQQPELNDLEKQLNINNENIKVYFENYMVARAQLRETHAQYYPTASISPGVTRSHSSGTLAPGANGVGTGNGAQLTDISLPLEISWAPDLFGRVRNAVKAARAAAQVSAADLENERLLEQATLAETFFEIRGQDQLLKILNDTVKADQEVLDLAQARLDVGTDSEVPVDQARETLEAAKAAAEAAAITRAQYEHAIATLLGKAATDFSMPVQPLVSQPPSIPTGAPSQLLERRPDIAAAERQMAQANANIGVGYAAYYPSLTISASGGFATGAISKLFNTASRTWSVGPSVSETIFDGGLRRATIQQYVATYNADLANYRQTVLNAFQQVEDTLAQTRLGVQEVTLQQAAVDAAQKAYDLEKWRYQTGLDPYLNLLTAQTTLLSAQQTLVNAQVQQMTSAVLLVEALGGGWDASQLPTAQQVSEKPPHDQQVIQQ